MTRSIRRAAPALLAVILAAGCAPPPAEAPPVDPLAELASGLASGRVEVVDLTQLLNEATPIIQLPPPLANSPPLVRHQISDLDDGGPGWYWNWFEVGEHHGTHFDAPCHWATGREGPCVDTIPAGQFIGPAVVVDVTAQVAENPDFVATRQTLLDWEAEHGRIPDGSWVVLRTGWGSRAQDAMQFVGLDDEGNVHWPGWGRESAEFLTTERNILGVGTEGIGTDAASGAVADPPFPNHSIMHGAGKFGLTQLANADRLPITGSVIIAAPIKFENGSGSPVRVIALVPAS